MIRAHTLLRSQRHRGKSMAYYNVTVHREIGHQILYSICHMLEGVKRFIKV